MPDDVWAVDYIIKADCKMRRDGKLTWIYTVKWWNYGHFSCTPLPGSDPLFEKDPALLKEFWESTPFPPERMRKNNTIMPGAPYIDKRKAISAARLENVKDAPAEKRVPRKRRRSSSSSGNRSPPFAPSPSSHTHGISPRSVVVSNHSDDSESLPDYEGDGDVVMRSPSIQNQSEELTLSQTDNQESPSQEEIYGPPELGTDDEDLYAPHPLQPTHETSLEEQESMDSTNIQPNVGSPSRSPHSPTTIMSHSPEVALLDQASAPLVNSYPSHGVTATPLPVQRITNGPPVSNWEKPGFGLAISANVVLPLELMDISALSFRDLFASRPRLDVHGFYRHADFAPVIRDWREGNTCDTAKLRLESSAVTEERRKQWSDFHMFLYEKEICSISFLPQTSHALIIFSSQSKDFGTTVGAVKSRMGFRNGIVVCRVHTTSHSVHCKRYPYGHDIYDYGTLANEPDVNMWIPLAD